MAKNPLNSAEADDLVAMGLPPAFTVDEMREFLDPSEIAAQAEGDDPLVDELPADIKAALVKSKSAHEELNPGTEDQDEDEAGDAAGDDDDDSSDGEDDGADDYDGDSDADADGDEEGAEGDNDDAADEADAPQDDAQAQEVDQTPDPVLTLKPTADLETKVAGFDDQIEALQQKYDDGELSNADFKAKLREITTEQAQATIELERTKDANTKAQQDYAQAWYGKVQAYTTARPELMDQKPIAGEPNGASAYQVFDQALRHVNSDAGAAQFGHLTMAQRIEAASILANEYIKSTTGKELLAPKAAPKDEPKAEDTPKPKKKAEEPGPRKDKRPEPIKTLGGIPAASDNEVVDSRFAALDKMDPLDAEAALDRMSESERAKYLAG